MKKKSERRGCEIVKHVLIKINWNINNAADELMVLAQCWKQHAARLKPQIDGTILWTEKHQDSRRSKVFSKVFVWLSNEAYRSNLIHYYSLMMRRRPCHILTLIKLLMSVWPLCKQGPFPFHNESKLTLTSPNLLKDTFLLWLFNSFAFMENTDFLCFAFEIKIFWLWTLYIVLNRTRVLVLLYLCFNRFMVICLSLNIWRRSIFFKRSVGEPKPIIASSRERWSSNSIICAWWATLTAVTSLSLWFAFNPFYILHTVCGANHFFHIFLLSLDAAEKFTRASHSCSRF